MSTSIAGSRAPIPCRSRTSRSPRPRTRTATATDRCAFGSGGRGLVGRVGLQRADLAHPRVDLRPGVVDRTPGAVDGPVERGREVEAQAIGFDPGGEVPAGVRTPDHQDPHWRFLALLFSRSVERRVESCLYASTHYEPCGRQFRVAQCRGPRTRIRPAAPAGAGPLAGQCGIEPL